MICIALNSTSGWMFEILYCSRFELKPLSLWTTPVLPSACYEIYLWIVKILSKHKFLMQCTVYAADSREIGYFKSKTWDKLCNILSLLNEVDICYCRSGMPNIMSWSYEWLACHRVKSKCVQNHYDITGSPINGCTCCILYILWWQHVQPLIAILGYLWRH